MIIANKGITNVDGVNIDIIIEFNSIVAALTEDHPEIVLGAISAWSTILEEKTEDVDTFKLVAISRMSEDFIKFHKKSEGAND